MALTFVDLVLDTGELVRIECPDKYEDALHDSINNARRRNCWWSPNQFDGCSAEFMGLSLSLVDMSRVVGEL